MITGEYDTDGYTIFQNHRPIYVAGNSPHDSQQYVGLKDALSIDTLATYCQDTIIELAKDKNDVAGECIRVF